MNTLQSMWFDFLRWRLRCDIDFLEAQIECMREDLRQMRAQAAAYDMQLLSRKTA